MAMDEIERKKRIAALLREHEGYRKSGKAERVKQVEAQLEAYGYKKDVRREPPRGATASPQQTRDK